jgi:hypothetical protein
LRTSTARGKVPSNHGNILRKDYRTIAAAVREVNLGREDALDERTWIVR